MEQDVPGAGRRTLILHASGGVDEAQARRLLLLSIEDVSDRRAAERESGRLLQQMETLLLANQHQIANSLQIVASILLLKARSVQSQETRSHLENVHSRIMSVATVQHQLLGTKDAGRIALAPYLVRLCKTLGASMVPDNSQVSIACTVDDRPGPCHRSGQLGAHRNRAGDQRAEACLRRQQYRRPDRSNL
jgi:chemotaxis protein methyltransferase CheR